MVCFTMINESLYMLSVVYRASVSSTKRAIFECAVDDVSLHDPAQSYSTMLSFCTSTVSLALMIPDTHSQARSHSCRPTEIAFV